MSTPPVIVGFRAAEISALVNRRVLEEHARESAFLWGQRQRAVVSPHFKLAHLSRLDERVHAHLSGLVGGGDASWRTCVAALGDDDPAAAFPAAHVAFESGQGPRIQYILELAVARREWFTAIAAALTWSCPPAARLALARMASAPVAEHRLLACTGMSVPGSVDDHQLSRWLEDPDPRVRAQASLSAGAWKRHALMQQVAQVGHDDDPACRFHATWANCLLHPRDGAVRVFDEGLAHPDLRRAAIELAMRHGDAGWAREIIRCLAADASTTRDAIHAVGAFGDPASLPWLLDHSDGEVHARAAAEAISTITGADLVYLDLDRDAPEGIECLPDDEELPWPDAAALARWWASERTRFASGQRYLAGRPVSVAGAAMTLRDGYQRMRAAAALELSRLESAEPLFPVRARADVQARRLSA